MRGAAPLRVAVVGHTNTGKTSLLRTLTRDVDFGEVSDHPSTTRNVEGAALLLGGVAVVELYDTPGLEDPIGLLQILDETPGGRRVEGIAQIRGFLESTEAAAPFAQEAKALRQVLASDLAVYVIDARDRVLAKHRDELEILGRCAVPVLPILNFVAGSATRSAEWKDQLARVSMHAVAEFDTVVLDAEGEEQLFQKMMMLADSHRRELEHLIRHLGQERARLIKASAELVAELAVDAAALVLPVAKDTPDSAAQAVSELRRQVRDREQRCVDALLALNRFRLNDVMLEQLPIKDGKWGLDLFSREALKQFGVGLSSAAATGAAAGLAVDAMVGGLSLGAGALAGALAGVGFQTLRRHGRRLRNRLRGVAELRLDDPTLGVLLTRQLQLVQSLLQRGHASVSPITLTAPESVNVVSEPIRAVLKRARAQPSWSAMATAFGYGDGMNDPARARTVAELAGVLADRIRNLAADVATAGGRDAGS